MTVGFIGSPYNTTEGDGETVVFRVGVRSISGGATDLQREISLLFSTADGMGPGNYTCITVFQWL